MIAMLSNSMVGGRVEGRERPTLRPGLAHGYNSMSRVRPTPTMMPNCKKIAGHMTPVITPQQTSTYFYLQHAQNNTSTNFPIQTINSSLSSLSSK